MISFSLSVVVPTLNAAKELPVLLHSLFLQSVKPHEILVVDSSSTDGTAEVAARFSGVRVLTIPRSEFDHGGTRHLAFLETTGDIVLFITQDAVPADQFYISRLLKPLSDPHIAMVSGRQLPKPNARLYEQLVRKFNYPEESNVRNLVDVEKMGIKAFYVSDVCSAYRRTAYLACGGFVRPCKTNEDMFMAAKLMRDGFEVAYAADACVYHSHNFSFREQYRRNKDIGETIQMNASLLYGVSEMSEGLSLVRRVAGSLMQKHSFFELAVFCVDCAARILGNRIGRYLARQKCIKPSTISK